MQPEGKDTIPGKEKNCNCAPILWEKVSTPLIGRWLLVYRKSMRDLV
jgi:hypothetical protein